MCQGASPDFVHLCPLRKSVRCDGHLGRDPIFLLRLATPKPADVGGSFVQTQSTSTEM